MSDINLPPGCGSAPGDEPLPRCCEDAATAECDACKGFNEDCAAYRAVMDAEADIERRFRRDFAEEIRVAQGSESGSVIGISGNRIGQYSMIEEETGA